MVAFGWPSRALFRGRRFPDISPMTRPLLVVSLGVSLGVTLGGAACASSSPADRNIGAVPRMQVAGNLRLNLLQREDVVKTRLAVKPADAWSALREAWADFGLPASVQDPQVFLLQIDGLEARRQFNKWPLRELLDCGRSSGYDNADTYVISMTVIAQLVPAGTNESDLALVFSSNGSNPLAMQSTVQCSSLGVFEERFANRVKAALAGR